ncbi:M24 family metallopeptidase [Deinococcus peraridilitoris]|uniref:Xaa-Pro aminopeptidase n=1 Tax=Deinococcus peraridilitoris (strain DSM 19664 / LMG 22246 / CIP 109416 / KR-200) TaxID=937777 RepID=K9ZWI9_DEIPD|nr:M24 family metallopeptidase [Deinococcus peraridilitoris]AFZ65951.1 Xaa-Pro aminopeptidase [Deinococcus peraridilitoris DSM 19664]
MSRVTEVAAKLGRLLEVLEGAGASALRLKGSEWFAWATAGGSNVVQLASETGVAEILVTHEGAFILTNDIEAERLREEEITAPFTVWSHPWADEHAREVRIRELSRGGRVICDRPQGDEGPLPAGTAQLRWTLLDGEVERYRQVGRQAAEAMTEALSQAQSDWTEAQLAGAGARALVSRDLEPALILAAGAGRAERYRHVTVKSELLGPWAMMVFCARGYGLYANLTRFVSFGELPGELARRHQALLGVEARLWAASKPGTRLDDLYLVAERAYADIGEQRAILEHHQGGVTGYRSREQVASPHTPEVLGHGMALAWNPSLRGAKIEDTILIGPGGQPEVLTIDPAWPHLQAEHGARPAVLEKRA